MGIPEIPRESRNPIEICKQPRIMRITTFECGIFHFNSENRGESPRLRIVKIKHDMTILFSRRGELEK